ncbi:MAG: AMP-binding protein [Chloroflexota bacterium]
MAKAKVAEKEAHLAVPRDFEADTLPKLLLKNYLRYRSRPAMRKKDFGLWNTYTWEQCYQHVKRASLGLLSLGLKPDDKVCIIGDNDPQWYWAEFAVQAAGGVAFGVFVDAMYDELEYYLNHSDARFVFAKDQEQCDKFLWLRERNKIPGVEKCIYWEHKGLWSYTDPFLMSFEQLEELGRQYEELHPGQFEENVMKGKGSDVAIFCYTSGTTAAPKAAMMSHMSVIFFGRGVRSVDPWLPTDEYLSYVSPAWAAEQFLGIASGLETGLCISFPEEPETVQEDIRDIGPQLLFYSARLWENLISDIQAKIQDTSYWKKLLYNTALKVGYRRAELMGKGVKPNPLWRALFWLADIMALRALRDYTGLLRTRVGYTAGAAVSPDVVRYFHAIGLNLKNIFGSTEASLVTIPRTGDIRFDSVGVPIEGCEVKIVDGEIVVKNPGVFLGYYKNPEATAAKLKEGWYYTGDAGWIDETGHLIYWDRVDELMDLPGGKFSPQFVETRLRFSPYIRDCMVVGSKERPYVTAIINVDYGNVGKWAEAKHISYTTFVDLSQKSQVCELVLKEVQRVNKTLPDYARVRKFVNLHKEFDPDEAELTRTRKLRRTFMEQRYGGIIETLYREEETYRVEAPVKYRDGRTGVISTEIRVNEVGD